MTILDALGSPGFLRDRVRRFCGVAGLVVMSAAALCGPLRAQTIDDGVMLSKRTLCTGVLYTRDRWDQYWEGGLERTNGNLGTVSTQMVNFTGNYGLTDRINVMAMAPYVWTNASQGVLKGQSGLQDITLAVKVNALQVPVRRLGGMRLIGVFTAGLPLTSYSPDLMPLSIGTHSKRVSGRVTLNYQGRNGLYLNGTAAYTWRENVRLDRSAYYTNGQLYLSNEVALPNVFDYTAAVGYHRGDLMLAGMFSQQQMRGGGDIRKQDMPFVSNRMNYSKAGGSLQYPLPKLRGLQYWLAYTNTFEGRNVGQSNTFTTGLMYTIHFERRARP